MIKKVCLFLQCCLVLGAGFLFLHIGGQPTDIRAEVKNNGKADTFSASAEDVPDHEVKYEGDFTPEWKANWDLARELYRENKYREAMVQYELLLGQKESVDEARWEYATLLIREKRWQQAGEQLDRLLANDPLNLDYGFARAEVYLNSGSIEAAVEMYRNLASRTAETSGTIRALEGLIHSLRQQGNPEEVLFYQEVLMALKPGVPELQMEFAEMALDAGRLQKARKVLDTLEEKLPDNSEVLRLQAELQHELGNMDAEAAYRQKLVSLHPDNPDNHAMLYAYYRERENWAMSLKHLEIMLRENPADTEGIEMAAELNMKLGRIDRALEYYESLLALQPNNESVLRKKTKAQMKLAEDLVILVEHDGGQKLWQDLVKVTSDRAGVYRQIASLLRENGNTEELVEVMTLICSEDPYDRKTFTELAALLKESGREDELRTLRAERQERAQ
jgi:tetratricopeptide (TPR) repeat protein